MYSYTLLTSMSTNRVKHFVISILQSSKLNREKFINNKKKHNIMAVKNRNYNMTSKRNYYSSINHHNSPFQNNPKLPNNLIVVLACGLYFIYKKNKK